MYGGEQLQPLRCVNVDDIMSSPLISRVFETWTAIHGRVQAQIVVAPRLLQSGRNVDTTLGPPVPV